MVTPYYSIKIALRFYSLSISPTMPPFKVFAMFYSMLFYKKSSSSSDSILRFKLNNDDLLFDFLRELLRVSVYLIEESYFLNFIDWAASYKPTSFLFLPLPKDFEAYRPSFLSLPSLIWFLSTNLVPFCYFASSKDSYVTKLLDWFALFILINDWFVLMVFREPKI